MADEYYVASAGESGWTSENANEYNKRMQRSTRVLSKFNKEQRQTAWQGIKSMTVVMTGANLLSRTFDRALGTMQKMVNKFTFAPMIDGIREYTDQLTSFQAIIQNSSQFFEDIGGAEQIAAITNALDELNEYADLTIYKFRDMQSAFTGFVNAGLTLEDSSAMARGIASLTAYMGKGAQEYSSAAYMFNQAMQQGKMQYYQWRSIEQFAGIGGEQTKKLFIQTAKALGKDAPDWEDLYNIYDSLGGEEGDQAFRDTLADDWLTGDVILEAMKILNQEYDEATLRSKGFTEEIINMANTALTESQKVRTFAQFMDAVVESIGTGWGQAFRAFFGDTVEATQFWTELMNTVTGDIGTLMDKVKDASESFVESGGRKAVQETLFNVWTILKNIGKTIGKIFPEDPGQTLARIAKGVASVTSVLAGITSISDLELPEWMLRVLNMLKRLKQVGVDIFEKAIKPIWDAFKGLVVSLGPQFLTFLENCVTWVEKLVGAFLNSGIAKGIAGIFSGTSKAIDDGNGGGILGFIVSFITQMKDVISGINLDGILGSIAEFFKAFTGLITGEGISSIFDMLSVWFRMTLGLAAAKSVFKKIATIAGYFDGLDVSFFKIVGSIMGIVIGMYMIASIQDSVLWQAAYKSILLSAALSILGKAFERISKGLEGLWRIIPVILVIVALVSAIIYAGYKIKQLGGDVQWIIDILKSVSNFLSKIAWLLVSLGAILAVFTARSIVSMIKAKQAAEAADALGDSLKEIFKKGRFTLNLKVGDTFAKRVAAITALLGGIFFYLKGVSDMIASMGDLDSGAMWRGTAVFGLTMVALGGLLAEIFLFTRKIDKSTEYIFGNAKKPKSQKMTESKTTNSLVSVAVLIGSIGLAVRLIAKSIATLANLDQNALWRGTAVVGIVFSAIAAIIYTAKFIKFDPKALLTLVMVGSIIKYLFVITLLCRWIGSWDLGAISRGAIVIGAVAAALSVLVVGVAHIAKSLSTVPVGVLTRAIFLIGTIDIFVGAIAALSATMAFLGHMSWSMLAKGGTAVISLLGVLVGVFGALTAIGKYAGGGSLKTMAMFGILISGIGVLAVLAAGLSLVPSERLGAAVATLAIIGGIAAGLLFVVAKIGEASVSMKAVLGVLAMTAIILVLTVMMQALVGLASINGDKLGDVVSEMVKLITTLTVLTAALGGLSSTSIGAGVIWLGIAALAALAGIFWVFSKGAKNFTDGVRGVSDGINDLIDAFYELDNINFAKFKSNLNKFLDTIESAVPRIKELSAALNSTAGMMILAGGDVTIGAGTVTVPSAAVSGSGTTTITGGFQQTQAGNNVYSVGSALFTVLSEGLNKLIFENSPFATLIKLFKKIGQFIDTWNEKGFKVAFKGLVGSDSTDTSAISSAIGTDLSQNIDVSKIYGGSNYSFLDKMALGEYSKSDVASAIDELKEQQRLTGASNEELMKAFQEMMEKKYSISIDGSKLGIISNEILGVLAEE